MLLLFNEQTINGNGLYNEKTQKKKKQETNLYSAWTYLRTQKNIYQAHK